MLILAVKNNVTVGNVDQPGSTVASTELAAVTKRSRQVTNKATQESMARILKKYDIQRNLGAAGAAAAPEPGK